jgi:predicted transcriptional regulator
MIITRSQRITIIRTTKPIKKDINQQLQWFGDSLGLFNLRDKDKSRFRIFIELLKAAKTRQPLTSDEIAEKLNLSRGTVIHHVNSLMEAGIVVHQEGRYMLRVENLKVLIEEIEKDAERALDDLKEIANDIDKRLGL